MCSLRFENHFLSILCVRFASKIIFFLYLMCSLISLPFLSWCPALAERIGTLSSTRVTQMSTARQETFPGEGNHDVHKMTHSAESERFWLYGCSIFLHGQFSTFVYRGSSHRRKSTAYPKFDMVWLYHSPKRGVISSFK